VPDTFSRLIRIAERVAPRSKIRSSMPRRRYWPRDSWGNTAKCRRIFPCRVAGPPRIEINTRTQTRGCRSDSGRLINDVFGCPLRSAESYGPIVVIWTTGLFWGRATQRETKGKAWEASVPVLDRTTRNGLQIRKTRHGLIPAIKQSPCHVPAARVRPRKGLCWRKEERSPAGVAAGSRG
jgi:hypothetical protein